MAGEAKPRVPARRLLKKYGYPPDKRKMAIRTVLDQAKLMSENIAA